MKCRIFLVKGYKCFGIYLSYNLLIKKIKDTRLEVLEFTNILDAKRKVEELYTNQNGFKSEELRVNKMYYLTD